MQKYDTKGRALFKPWLLSSRGASLTTCVQVYAYHITHATGGKKRNSGLTNSTVHHATFVHLTDFPNSWSPNL